MYVAVCVSVTRMHVNLGPVRILSGSAEQQQRLKMNSLRFQTVCVKVLNDYTRQDPALCFLTEQLCVS